jgi:hypothetical protein
MSVTSVSAALEAAIRQHSGYSSAGGASGPMTFAALKNERDQAAWCTALVPFLPSGEDLVDLMLDLMRRNNAGFREHFMSKVRCRRFACSAVP